MLNIRLRKCPTNHHVVLGNFEFPREFACKCGCGKCEIDFEVWLVCQLVRQRFKAPVVVRSGCRCDRYNQDIDGAPNSDHKFGWAADIYVPGIEPQRIAEFVRMIPDAQRIGIYEPAGKNGDWGFVHIGVRNRGPGRWKRWRFGPQRELLESK